MWKKSSESIPSKDTVVIAIDGSRLFYAKHLGEDEWFECEPDGGMAFSRDGTPLYIDTPHWWCEPPAPP
jgi:hypothetical protein